MNIEVGEYVRTKKGKIFQYGKGRAYLGKDNAIVKHSKVLSEVVEVGDWVNGKRIHKIDRGKNYCYLYYGNCKTFVDYQIKTILTKEQYHANCYKIHENISDIN